MPESSPEALELTYPLRAASRLTGLSPELLRAWERRYGVVEPLRTPGGTRRYRAADIERLKLVKAAVDAGHRIGQVAALGIEELRERVQPAVKAAAGRLDEVLAALDRLDGPEVQRLLSLQLSSLGPVRFAREFAGPLVNEIGERWATDRMGVSSEHLATGVLRSMLGSALQPTAASLMGTTLVFGTPTGERHELGLLMAALTALGAGANPLYLGADLPVDDLLGAVEQSHASALCLSLVGLTPSAAERVLRALRGGLAPEVFLWVGGSSARSAKIPEGVEHMEDLDSFERRVSLLGLDPGRTG